ncbi:MAG TPA: hypothetical protein VG297_11200 [Bryobacteraceae bacterium]|jgi:hypothetical protein|nr:hypothetical protein [Bryobacteraceae bacterium]
MKLGNWNIPDVWAIAGLAGLTVILSCIFCLIRLRNRRLAAERGHALLREELRADLRGMREQQDACQAEVAQLGRNVALLESSGQEIGNLTRGFARPLRAQAIELLRSGMPAEKIAQKLGIAMREMRLIAQVSRTLLLE